LFFYKNLYFLLEKKPSVIRSGFFIHIKQDKEYSMKSVIKLIGVIVLVTAIGLSMVACGGNEELPPVTTVTPGGDEDPPSVMRTVTFDANGGTVEGATTKTVKVKDGQNVTLPAPPVNSPKIFWDWFDNKTAPYGNPFNAATPITADKTVYARWGDTPPPQLIDITFEANDGKFEGDGTTQVIKIYQGDTVNPPYVTRNDYMLSGWDSKANGTGTAFNKDTPITAAITFYAQWKKPEEMPDKDRWSIYSLPSSSAKVGSYSIDNDGLFTITVSGTAEADTNMRAWTVSANYKYTAKAGKWYWYTFEAWTEVGDRDMRVQFYATDDVYLNGMIRITNTKSTYDVGMQKIPSDGIQDLSFQLANQTGTVYIKIIEIEEYKPSIGEIFKLSSWFFSFGSFLPEKWKEWGSGFPYLIQTGTPTYEFDKTNEKIIVRNIVNNWDGIDIRLDDIRVNTDFNKIKIEVEGKILELNQTMENYDNRGGQIRIQNMPGYGLGGVSEGGLAVNDTFTITIDEVSPAVIKLRITSNAAEAPNEEDPDHSVHGIPYVKSFEITKIIITNIGER
jgi:hypothetical protein